MAEFFKYAPVTSAAYKAERPINISCNTLTTLDYYALNPVYHRMLDAHERITIDASVFCKLNPMQKPVLGNCRIVSRAFFVPYYQVFKYANEFFTQTLISDPVRQTNYIIKRCPYTYMTDLATLLSDGGLTDELGTSPVPTHFDIRYVDASGAVHYLEFNRYGRIIKTILEGLGYKVSFPQTTEDWAFYNEQNLPINVLPILSFCKLYYDWYANRSYANAEVISMNLLKSPDPDGIYYDASTLQQMLQVCCYALFDSDYFTSQFDRPTAPNESVAIPPFTIPDVTHKVTTPAAYRSEVTNESTYSNNGTPMLLRGDKSQSTPANISQYILDSLKAATDYVTARQFSGNKVIDNFLIQFGYKSPYENVMQSMVCGHFDTYINIGEVTATTENASANQVLGDFAGRAQGSSSGHKISFEAPEKGSFFIVSYVEAQTGYVQGIQRYLFDTAPNDFYNGRFDGLGPQATYVSELFCDQNGNVAPNGNPVRPFSKIGGNDRFDSIFGFMPRYSHLKIGYDVMSGDFSRGMYYDTNQVWHLFRDFRQTIGYLPGNVPRHDYDLTYGYDQNFNRVFAITDRSIDNFQTDFYFNIRLYTNKLPLWQSYEFDHEDEHKKIMQQINGSKVD